MRAWRTVSRSSLSIKASPWLNYAQRRHRSIANILQHAEAGEDITVTAWVKVVRQQKHVVFVNIADGSTVKDFQAVLNPADGAKLSIGTAVEIQGQWKSSSGKKQTHELVATHVRPLGENDAARSPYQPKYQTTEYLRTIPHFRARTFNHAHLLRLRSQLIAKSTSFFADQGFVQCHTPIITSSDCEGAGEVFTVSSNGPNETSKTHESESGKAVDHFFKEPKFLTVSAQLHLEALALAVNKVWTLSPTFRAEQSDTARHLSEFYMLEAEMCFIEDLNDVMDLIENMLRIVTKALNSTSVREELRAVSAAYGNQLEGEHKFDHLKMLTQRWDGLMAPDWPRITYAEAFEVLEAAHELKKAEFEFPPPYENGLQAEHERFIATTIGQGRPVFVTDYPRAQKPFYMSPSLSTKESRGTADTVACFDLLVPDLCELAGGSLREHRSKELLEAMKEKGVEGNNLEWYQDLRKYGSTPHGGFGLGFDRLICYLAGVQNVRDVVAFPRWYGRCDC